MNFYNARSRRTEEQKKSVVCSVYEVYTACLHSSIDSFTTRGDEQKKNRRRVIQDDSTLLTAVVMIQDSTRWENTAPHHYAWYGVSHHCTYKIRRMYAHIDKAAEIGRARMARIQILPINNILLIPCTTGSRCDIPERACTGYTTKLQKKKGHLIFRASCSHEKSGTTTRNIGVKYSIQLLYTWYVRVRKTSLSWRTKWYVFTLYNTRVCINTAGYPRSIV